jgi:HlyD family secretion protein
MSTPIQDTPRTEADLDHRNGSGSGEGIDRQLKKRTFTPMRVGMGAGILALTALIIYAFVSSTGGKRLNVEVEKVTIATVTEGPFQELITVTGTVLPQTTVYLDAVEGGRIEEVFIREGAEVEAGQPILRLSNNDLQLRMLNAEAQRIEQRDRLQNTRFNMEMNSLNLRQQLTEMNYQIQRLERQFERQQELFDKQLVSQQEYQTVRDEYEYWQRRKDLTLQAFRQDSLRMESQVAQMEDALLRMETNFDVIQDNLENLTLRAPIDGQLSALNAEVGEIRTSGFRFGQIDVLDGYRVRAQIDEFYISRVTRGQPASGEISGQEYQLMASRVYPEVRESRFEVDFDFVSEPPPGIRRGQTLRFRLEMSDPAEAVMVPRGGFYQTTGGNWMFVVDPSGDFAVKRFIQLGRQNPTHFELVQGLEPGERVITSSYETFGDADRLVLTR